MSLWGRKPKPPKPDPDAYVVVRGRCWDDLRLDALADALEAGSRAPAELVDEVLRELAARRTDPEGAALLVGACADRLVDQRDAVRERASQAGDAADRADALALLAEVVVAAAWQVRGSGMARTVGQDAFRVFHGMLGEAEESGLAALRLVPGHPAAAVARLGSGLGLGLPTDEWWRRLDEARTHAPTLWAAHQRMLQALCEKWHGSHDRMFDFARRLAAEAPVGDPIGGLLAEAHFEYRATESNHRIPRADLALVTAASDRWFAGGADALAHPRARQAHHVFAWFMLIEEEDERAREHLVRTGGRLASVPWESLRSGNGERLYRTFLSENRIPVWPA